MDLLTWSFLSKTLRKLQNYINLLLCSHLTIRFSVMKVAQSFEIKKPALLGAGSYSFGSGIASLPTPGF
jgi:hypothetical protein